MGEGSIDYSRVAIFPLPQTVFFPRTTLPLHVFEPRYRAMTEACLSTGMAMAVCLARPGEDLMGHAEVFPVAGVGLIERSERLPDGRFHIWLRGLSRMRIEEELPSRPYRCVRGVPLVDRWPHQGPGDLTPGMDRLRAIVERLAELAGDASAVREMRRRVHEAADASLLSDTVASLLIADPLLRQSLLEELGVEQRLTRVTDLVAEVLLNAEAARRPKGEPVQ